jgi:hypothetical protein
MRFLMEYMGNLRRTGTVSTTLDPLSPQNLACASPLPWSKSEADEGEAQAQVQTWPRLPSPPSWRTRSTAELASTLADALERHMLKYAVGGAIALGYYAVPCATVDVDVNVVVAPTGVSHSTLTEYEALLSAATE